MIGNEWKQIGGQLKFLFKKSPFVFSNLMKSLQRYLYLRFCFPLTLRWPSLKLLKSQVTGRGLMVLGGP